MCVCSCLSAHVNACGARVCVPVRACACGYRLEVNIRCPPQSLNLTFLRQALSLNWNLLVSLHWQTPRICLSLPPGTVITTAHCGLQLLIWVLVMGTQVLVFLLANILETAPDPQPLALALESRFSAPLGDFLLSSWFSRQFPIPGPVYGIK